MGIKDIERERTSKDAKLSNINVQVTFDGWAGFYYFKSLNRMNGFNKNRRKKMEEQEKDAIEEKLKIESKFKSGASWFFWIAGLSIINSIILLAGGQWNFIVGLGVTQIIDVIGMALAKEVGNIGLTIAFVFDLLAAGVFIVFGVFARKGYSWAFIIGMISYALDGLIFLLVQDWLGVGFHAFALFFIYGGFKANNLLKRTGNNIKPLEPV